MGILDDAIREHLELKRRAGADAAEIARLERTAFGDQAPPPAPAAEEQPVAAEQVPEPPVAAEPEPEPVVAAVEPEPEPDPILDDLEHLLEAKGGLLGRAFRSTGPQRSVLTDPEPGDNVTIA